MYLPTKGTLKKKKRSAKDLLDDIYAIFFSSDFLNKSIASRKYTYIILTPLNPTFI